MPRSSITSDGRVLNIDVDYATTLEIKELLLWNHTGSSVVVTLLNPLVVVELFDESGNKKDIGKEFIIGPDETVHLVTANNAVGADTQVFSFKSTHGSIKPGTRHQKADGNLPGIFIAEL